MGQNPFNHVTPTNNVLDAITSLRDWWRNQIGFRAQGLDNIKPRMLSACRGLMQGFYRDEIAAGKTIFDKNRGWIASIEVLEEILESPVRVVACVRDVRDVIASFEKIHRKAVFTEHQAVDAEEALLFQTIEGRATRWLQQKHDVGYAVAALRDAYLRGVGDRIVVVRYRDLTHDPVRTIRDVHGKLGLPPFDCDPANVKMLTPEDDTVYGMQLHQVKKIVAPDHGGSWRGVLPDGLSRQIDDSFSDIQSLARGESDSLPTC